MENTFEYRVSNDDFDFKYAKGEPTLRNREYHDYNEFLFFINGNLKLVSKNIQNEISAGTIILIPKEHFHQFSVGDEKCYTRCVFGFYETSQISALVREVMNEIKVISNPDRRILDMFSGLIEIAKSDLSDNEKRLYVKSSLPQLLILFKRSASEFVNKSDDLSSISGQALEIIDEKYNEHLSVGYIARLLNVSPSTLSHRFKCELGISVYRCITQKRIVEARKLIRNGQSMTYAAAKSGFRDYSCFYRLYKKYYQ